MSGQKTKLKLTVTCILFLLGMIILIWYVLPYIQQHVSKQTLTNTKPVALNSTYAQKNIPEKKMFTLAPLPYSYNALEPSLDARTMEIHYAKHHQAYTNNLNKTLKEYPDLAARSIEDLLTNVADLPEEIRTQVRNFGGGYYNHTLYWNCMKPQGGGEPKGKLAQDITKTFGSFEEFKTKLSDAAKKQFGSGWGWLSVDQQGKLIVSSTLNQDCPLSLGHTPLMCIDVWEHAYYLQYQQKRADFVDNWWHVVDWDSIEKRYQATQK